MKKLFSSVIEDPEEWSGHKILGEFAEKVIEFEETGPRDEAVNYSVFGRAKTGPRDEAVNYSVFGRAKMGPTPGPRYVNKNSGSPEFAAHPEAVTEAAYAAAQFHQ